MLTTDGSFFIRLPAESDERILHPARVAGLEDGIYTARVEDAGLPLTDGLDFLIYYEKDRQLVQQPAHVLAISVDEPGLVIQISTTGGPVSAETRQYYRASAVMSGLTVEFGDESECPLLDVSCTGFAVAATKPHQIGNQVDAVLSFEGIEYRGHVCVQSARALGKGRTRYGLLCYDSRDYWELRRGLHRLNLSLQQEQLSRLLRRR